MKPIPHRPALFLSACIILFGATVPTFAAEELNRFKLTVTVVYANGQKVQGAVVTVTHDRVGPEVRPFDYRMETDANGVASTEIMPTGRGEGTAYWPTLNIEAKKGARVATTSVKVSGTRLTSGVRYPDVERTLTIEGDAETERSKINVAVNVNGDDGSGIPSAAISIRGPEGTYPGRTDSNGKASIAVPFLPKAEYWVSATKRGYESKERLVLLEASPTSSTIEAPIVLKKGSTPDGIVVTINVKKEGSPDAIREAHVKIMDTSGVVSDDYYRSTNASGVATLRLPGPGTYPISIEQDSFEPYQGQIQLAAGEEAKTFNYTLREKGSGESITVTVLAGDVKNGKGSFEPIRGATVQASGASAVTDGNGNATLSVRSGIKETEKGAGYAEAVDVTVSANGYRSQTRSVQLKRTQHRNMPGAAAETFTLELGEDKRADDTPIKILVQVSDPIGPVNLAKVTVGSGNASLGSKETDGKGEKDFDSGSRTGEALADMRKGLTVNVTHTGHKVYQSTISPDLLSPSQEVRRYAVQLEKDWTDLTKAITTLEERIGYWKSEARSVGAKAQSVNLLSAKCAAARGRAEALLGELKSARRAFDAKLSGNGCKEAGDLVKAIQSAQTEASTKEKTLRTTLDEAIGLAAACKSKAEGDAIIAKQSTAIKLTAEIGRLEKEALASNQKLTSLAQTMRDAGPLQAQLQQAVDKIEAEINAAGKDAATADNDFDEALKSSKELPGRRAPLLEALDQLRADHHVREYDSVLPANLHKRLDNLEAVLRSGGADMSMSFPPTIDRSRLDVIKENVSKLQELKTQADGIVSGLKAALCNVQPLDDVVREIGSIVTGTTIELGAAGDLRGKALACAGRAAPSPTSATPTPSPSATPKPSPSPSPSASPTPEDEMVTVPSVKGAESIDYARTILNQAGFKSGFKAIKPKDKKEELTVSHTSPGAGEKAKRGSLITVFIFQKFEAETPTPTATPTPTPTPAKLGNMPTLTGLTLDQAVTRLPSNMRIGSDEIGDAPPSPGLALTIFYQNPSANSSVDLSKPLTVIVKRYGSAQATLATAVRFDGTYFGSYRGADKGAVRFTVSGGAISIQSPGSGSGQVTASGSARISGAGNDGNSSYSFTGTFSVAPDGKATANGSWTGQQSGFKGSGTWSAARP